MRDKWTIGIDEVGRGPIAGPVAVGAFTFLNKKAIKIFSKAKESKQLTEAEREYWFAIINDAKSSGLVDYKVCFKSEKLIDSKGLSFCIKGALSSAIHSLKIKPKQSLVLLDGGLKAPVEYKNQKTIIKGDEKEMVIALASICAKVLRDRKMNKLSKIHPEYGFHEHKGYGTLKHYVAIKNHGILPIHRKSFLKRIA